MDEPIVGSFFSGIGGDAIGLEREGFAPGFFCEIEEHAQGILRRHWPNTTVHGDITRLDFGNLPRVDITIGGSPCQDISNAGKRAGITGSRSSLWKHYAKAIGTLRPRLAIVENVAALIDRGLDVILADLAAIGYDAEWYCFPASSVGAPHQRDRIVILAYPHGGGCVHGPAIEFPDKRGQPSQPFPRKGCEVVADAHDRQPCEPDEELRAGWGAVDESVDAGAAGVVEDASVIGWEQEGELRHRGFQERVARAGEALGDLDDQGLQKRVQEPNGENGQQAGGAALSTGGRSAQRGLGGSAHGVPRGFYTPGWVAGRGEAQKAWEPPRLIKGQPNREERIKRLGNAIVPEWAQAIGRAVQRGGF